MRHTNNHKYSSKHPVLRLVLYLQLAFLLATANSYANHFGFIMYAKNSNNYQISSQNTTKKTNSNTTQKGAFDSHSNSDNLNLAELKQISTLLTLVIVLLVFLTIILWKRNMALGYETSQIKSKLNQYHVEKKPDEDLKLIQEEHKQQALILNERQQKIVDLMAFGFSNKQIADKLFISENTVKYHIKNIYHVLHVKDRKALWLSQS